MENAKNVRWLIPFKKFGMVRVNLKMDSVYVRKQQQIRKKCTSKQFVVQHFIPIVYNSNNNLYKSK